MDIDAIQKFAELFGVNVDNLAVVVPIIVAIVALCKEHFKVSGQGNMIVAGILAVIWNALMYQPNLTAIIAGTVLTWVVAMGGWAAVKQLIKKAAK